MEINDQADRDFARARRRARLRRLVAYLRLNPASNRLLSFDEVRGEWGPLKEVYVGKRAVPVQEIVGSVGRHRDFDRAFLPGKESLRERWKRVDWSFYLDEGVPPVSLYKLGDAYFVRDGNHRVSVARQRGFRTINAEVVELRRPEVDAEPAPYG